MKILIGADPELFLTTPKGTPRSAHGVIPGTKQEPYKVDKGAIQVDGMAAEFNIDPAATQDEFVTNVKTVMSELRKAVPMKYQFKIASAVTFRADHIAVQPPEALELGCDPDYNAYTGEANPQPVVAVPGLRTAAGHIHVGFLDEPEADPKGVHHMIRCATLIKQMDRYVGLPLRLLERGPNTRRTLYGKAGAFRPKSYGVEYRTPSNEWLKSEEMMRLVYDASVAAVEDLLDGYRAEDDISIADIDSAIKFNSYHAKDRANYYRLCAKTDRLKSVFDRIIEMCRAEKSAKAPAGQIEIYANGSYWADGGKNEVWNFNIEAGDRAMVDGMIRPVIIGD